MSAPNTDLSATFDRCIDHWQTWQQEPWGRLRYAVVHANLLRHLPPPPLRVLDAGGGNALDSLPLAARGDDVTLLDFSPAMLIQAERNAAEHHVADRFTVRQGDLASLPEQFHAGSFDLILCHNVLQYVENMPATLDLLLAALAPGGLLSILSVNRYTEVYRAAIQQMNPTEALANLDASIHTAGMFSVEVPMYSAEDLIAPLQARGCHLLGRYGVRCFMDYIADNDRKQDPTWYHGLEQLELAATDRFPYYLTARFFQLIAQR